MSCSCGGTCPCKTNSTAGVGTYPYVPSTPKTQITLEAIREAIRDELKKAGVI